MCTTCGCSDDATPTITDVQTGQIVNLGEPRDQSPRPDHNHDHDHDDDHDHDHDSAHHHDHRHMPRRIHLEQEILAKNVQIAERNRGWLMGRNILALNLVSAPGAGKTALL